MIPLAPHLPEFGRQPAAGRILPILSPEEPVPDTVAEIAIAEAYECGQAEARADAEAVLAQSLEAQRLDLDRNFAAERKAWAVQQGERLAERFSAAMTELERLVTGCAARILQPFVETAVRERAIRDLAVCLGEILSDENPAAVKVSGPQDMLDELAVRLGPHAKGLEFVAAAACDVTVNASETRIDSRIGDWLRGIGGSDP